MDDYTCKEDGVGDGKNKEVVEAAWLKQVERLKQVDSLKLLGRQKEKVQWKRA